MADFKSIMNKLEDNNKSAIYINQIKGFNGRKDYDELTSLVEKGWGQKVVLGRAVLFTVIVDRDEFDRICKEVDTEMANA